MISVPTAFVGEVMECLEDMAASWVEVRALGVMGRQSLQGRREKIVIAEERLKVAKPEHCGVLVLPA